MLVLVYSVGRPLPSLFYTELSFPPSPPPVFSSPGWLEIAGQLVSRNSQSLGLAVASSYSLLTLGLPPSPVFFYVRAGRSRGLVRFGSFFFFFFARVIDQWWCVWPHLKAQFLNVAFHGSCPSEAARETGVTVLQACSEVCVQRQKGIRHLSVSCMSLTVKNRVKRRVDG